MQEERRYGLWKGRKVLFIGDSLTAARIYPEVVKEILGIETFYHCKGGATFQHMVDGDKGLGGEYDNETDASGVLRPLTPEDVKDMDLIVFFGGYNCRHLEPGCVGDLYKTDGTGQNTIAGNMQYVIQRIYENLLAADNMLCRLLAVTVDCSGKYPWVDADGYTDTVPGNGKSFENMSSIQKQVAQHNGIPCCDLFRNSGINAYTWAWFGKDADPVNHEFSPYKLDEKGKPMSLERIRYVMGESYYQIRDGKVVLEKYEERKPFPYIGDQLHKSEAGYRRIGEVVAGAIIAAYGN